MFGENGTVRKVFLAYFGTVCFAIMDTGAIRRQVLPYNADDRKILIFASRLRSMRRPSELKNRNHRRNSCREGVQLEQHQRRSTAGWAPWALGLQDSTLPARARRRCGRPTLIKTPSDTHSFRSFSSIHFVITTESNAHRPHQLLLKRERI